MFKKAILPALALAAASVAIPASASAQSYGHGRDHDRYERYDRHDRYERADYGWQSINQRQRQLDRRIDQGVRSGQLSRREAQSLRSEFNALARLEARYRRGGLTRWEMSDLDRRFDRLEARIRIERRDRDGRRW